MSGKFGNMVFFHRITDIPSLILYPLLMHSGHKLKRRINVR